MTRALPSLLLPLLAVAACQTDRMPIMGFFTQPDGTLLLKGNGNILIKPILGFDGPPPTFRIRFNDQFGVLTTASGGPGETIYDYLKFSQLQPWTAGIADQVSIPPDTYVVELVDDTGRSWGKSDPLPVHEAATGSSGFAEVATVLFVHFDAQAGTFTIDPTTQDSDPMTSEITVTNLTTGEVVVDRCVGPWDGRTCTPVGTIEPGADLHTVETIALSTTPSTGDASALVIHTAENATPASYERPLVEASAFTGACEVERIIVHGVRDVLDGHVLLGFTPYATTSCNSY